MRITIKQKYSTKLQYKVKHHAGGSSHPFESPLRPRQLCLTTHSYVALHKK